MKTPITPVKGQTYYWDGPSTSRFVGTCISVEGAVITFLMAGKTTRLLDDGRFTRATVAPEKETQNV